MSLIAVGLHHRTAPIELLERVAIAPTALGKALDDLTRRAPLSEAVVVSTCNRTEVYARTERYHPGVAAITEFLAGVASLDTAAIEPHLVTYFDDRAVAHLFTVAAGLDSLVVGEHEILGQVRRAWEHALVVGAAGTTVGPAFRHAVAVGKRARTETAIGRHARSVATVSVQLAQRELGSLAGRRVVLLGAGAVGAGVARALQDAGAGDVVVANRTHAHATALAERIGARAIALDELADALTTADVLLTSTGAPDVVLEYAELEGVMARRDHRALLIVDVAVPRDVDPGAARIEGITLYDIDDLRRVTERAQARREVEIDAVQAIVAEELERYVVERQGREVAPLITAMRAQAEQIRREELARFRTRLDDLPPDARDAIDAITRSLMQKLLHDPTVRLKEAAGTPRGERLADALGELFRLDERP